MYIIWRVPPLATMNAGNGPWALWKFVNRFASKALFNWSFVHWPIFALISSQYIRAVTQWFTCAIEKSDRRARICHTSSIIHLVSFLSLIWQHVNSTFWSATESSSTFNLSLSGWIKHQSTRKTKISNGKKDIQQWHEYVLLTSIELAKGFPWWRLAIWWW